MHHVLDIGRLENYTAFACKIFELSVVTRNGFSISLKYITITLQVTDTDLKRCGIYNAALCDKKIE